MNIFGNAADIWHGAKYASTSKSIYLSHDGVILRAPWSLDTLRLLIVESPMMRTDIEDFDAIADTASQLTWTPEPQVNAIQSKCSLVNGVWVKDSQLNSVRKLPMVNFASCHNQGVVLIRWPHGCGMIKAIAHDQLSERMIGMRTAWLSRAVAA